MLFIGSKRTRLTRLAKIAGLAGRAKMQNKNVDNLIWKTKNNNVYLQYKTYQS